MTPSVASFSNEGTNSHQNADIYPENGGRFGDVGSSSLPAHEAVFHQWNNILTQNYTNAHPGVQCAQASLSRYPLYRLA